MSVDDVARLREARIDLDALRSNLATVRRLVDPAIVMAVVKADAYGHGAALVAPALVDAGVAWFGVADLDEALALRSAGITTPVLAWLHGPSTDFAPAVSAGVDEVILVMNNGASPGLCTRKRVGSESNSPR